MDLFKELQINTNLEHNHQVLSQLTILIYCLIKALEEKQLLFRDEIKEEFYNRVREITENEENANKKIKDLFDYIFMKNQEIQ